MAIFTIKLLKNIRSAVAGRKHPHQLAWAVAFGVLLGLVPHGNLLALALLILVLALQINHAMAAVAAIGTTFLATRLDPLSDRVGSYLLSHEKFGPLMADAWQLPLVPWTDLNNTVVMGSFVIGIAALIPIFLITYPLFRLFKPADEPAGDPPSGPVKPVRFVDRPHGTAPSHLVNHPAPAKEKQTEITIAAATASESPPAVSVDRYHASGSDQQTAQQQQQPADDRDQNKAVGRASVQTRIDVIRMKDSRDVSSAASGTTGSDTNQDVVSAGDYVTNTEKPLDEALNYLLRQLRDSQQRKAG